MNPHLDPAFLSGLSKAPAGEVDVLIRRAAPLGAPTRHRARWNVGYHRGLHGPPKRPALVS